MQYVVFFKSFFLLLFGAWVAMGVDTKIYYLLKFFQGQNWTMHSIPSNGMMPVVLYSRWGMDLDVASGSESEPESASEEAG